MRQVPNSPAVLDDERTNNRERARTLTVSRRYEDKAKRPEPFVPMIRMRGRWLQKLGFRTGARIVVTAERNRIVLTLAGEE